MKYIDADLLRERIAKQMESLPREVGRGAGTITSKGYGMMEAFQIVRSIIDSLHEESDKDLEETSMNYIAPIENEDGLKVINFSGQDIKDAFIAGAEWQKAKMMDEWLKDRDGCFWDGVNEGKKAMKEQMMEDAVEGEVENGSFGIVYLRKNLVNEGYSTGDKVKIIIVKEDGE